MRLVGLRRICAAEQPESAVSRNYLDKILELPWHIYSKENLNIDNAQRILDRIITDLKTLKSEFLNLLL